MPGVDPEAADGYSLLARRHFCAAIVQFPRTTGASRAVRSQRVVDAAASLRSRIARNSGKVKANAVRPDSTM